MIDLATGLVVGIGGSLHCAGMCGPLALALPLTTGSRWRYSLGRILYSVGRTLTYAVLGLAAGFAGRGIALAGAQQVVSILLGVGILLALIAPMLLRRMVPSFMLPGKMTGWVTARLAALMRHSSPAALLGIGMLNGLLPCGFVYMGLAAATTLGTEMRAVLFMAGFGLGTLPVMTLIGMVGKRVQEGVRQKLLRLVPVFTAALAVLLILRGLNLGIPYVSPRVPTQQATQTHCH